MIDPELARCDLEIAQAEAAILAGDPHEDELLIWWADWKRERAILKAQAQP